MPRSFSLLLVLLAPAVSVALSAADPALPDGLYAEIGTPRGTVVCELFFPQVPLTVANFVGLAEGTLGPTPRKPYFDGVKFHRVVPDFVVQGGDPSGTGDGGPGYTFPDEFAPALRHDAAGVLSMANRGPDTNGSQFFLTLRETNRLNFLHSVFGRVVRGLDVLPRIQRGDTMTVAILRRGTAARAFRADEAAFRALAARAKPYTAPLKPGPAHPFDDPEKILPLEPSRAKHFNAKLANVERTTGLKIVARLRAKSPTDAEDAQPGAFMRALAEKLGTARDGALAVYFADDDSWRVWVGDALTARFTGRPGTAAELTASGAIHEVKEAFLQAAQKRGNDDFKQQQETLAAAKQPAPPSGQRVKLQTDAILDGLIARLLPAAEPAPR